MDISVIIPTYNAQKYLPALLEKLNNQTLKFELIIIDSSSTDDTLNIAKKYTKNIITISQAEFDHGATRTKASKVAKGEIVVFLTQDALPVGDSELENLVKVFEQDSKIGAVYGKQLPYKDATLFGRHLREFNYGDKSHILEFKDREKYGIKTAFFSDSFSAYRKSALKSVGYFKAGTIVGEDMHIIARMLIAGYKKAYCANAKVYHSHNYTILQEFQRYFDTGVFHTCEAWLIDKFGKAEGEGKRYIKSEFNLLLQNRAYHLIPNFIVRNGAKLIGYKLGKKYKKLPMWLVKKCSMHKSWWDRWALKQS